MSDSQPFADLLVQHLPFIQKMAARFCRADGLDANETDDFVSWAHERLIENDYAVFQKFRGDSALTTYLTVVLSMLYRDYRVARWGRWRPSAEAKRQGELAVKLEQLVHRDRYSLKEAVRILLDSGATTLSEREVFALFERLPAGVRGRPVSAGEAPLDHVTSPDHADHGIREHEADAERARMREALNRAMEGLAHEDRVIMRLRFLEGQSVADIARSLRIDQKPLYRRVERLLLLMRGELEAAGISRQNVADMIADDEK